MFPTCVVINSRSVVFEVTVDFKCHYNSWNRDSGTVRWNSETLWLNSGTVLVEQWNSVGGPVEQCRWNSEGGTVLVEQC